MSTAGETLENDRRRLAVLDGLAPDQLMVHEIYASIQGESSYAGQPCGFVRLTGCPLRCRWCDTPYAFQDGQPMTIAAIVAAVENLSPQLVELTGGEPLAQPLAFDLATALADASRKVLIETSGAISIAPLDPRVTAILDIKCPGSGEAERNDWNNLGRLRPQDELKFVIADRNDFDWAVQVVRDHNLARQIVHFAPVFGELAYETLCAWILETRLPIRFQPQLHKHIWNPRARGV